MSADVIVLGSLNVDLVMSVPCLPAAGETVSGGTFTRRRGGKGANQAVAAARLGGRVRMVGGVGADDAGRYALEGLAAEGVDTALVRVVDGEATGTAVNLVGADGENLIAVAPGANARIDLPAGFADALASGPGVLLASLEVPVDTVLRAAALALEAGWQVVVNPAPAPPAGTSWPSGAVLTPNEGELQSMAGVADVDSAARQLAAVTGCRIVATLGGAGALGCDGSSVERIAGVPVQCVDATGAGDAFNGALAMGLATGLPLGEAVELANAAAAYSTETAGAQEGLLTGDQLQHRLRR
jgi:ribokinase